MQNQVIVGIDEAIKAVMEYQNWKYDKAREYVYQVIRDYKSGNITALMDLREMVNHYYTKRGYTLIG